MRGRFANALAEKVWQQPGLFPPVVHTDRAKGVIGTFSGPTVANSSVAAVNRARARFVARAKYLQSPFQGGVFVGELKETIELVVHPAKTLFRGLTSEYLTKAGKTRLRFFKNRKPTKSGIRKASQAITDLWLEYAYGVRPLTADILGGTEALMRLILKRGDYEAVNAQDEDESPVSMSGEILASTNNLDWKYVRKVVDKVSIRLEGAVHTASQQTSTPFVRELLSFNWSDLIPTIWELIPGSFLVDYFTNIGEGVAAASFCDSSLIWASQTLRTVRTETITVTGWPGTVDPWQKSRRVVSGNSSIQVVNLSRSIPSTYTPSLSFKCPGVDSLRWLNVAALLNGRLPYVN
jgi:hypothetical protein